MQPSRIKIIASAIILVVGLIATIVALPGASDVAENSGILVDFGDYNVTYTAVNADDHGDPVSALQYACGANDFPIEMNGEYVVSINGVGSDGFSEWGLYVVDKGQTEWTKVVSHASSISLSDYSAVCWGFCTPETTPAPAVDMTGVCFYGNHGIGRIVSLAPACTEYVCAVGSTDRIVATDYYSNHPSEIVDRQNDGSIDFVGGFTNPSYETVLKQDPDLVVCVDSVNSHLSIAEKLRNAGVDVLVVSGGESIDAVMDNMFMVGTALGSVDEALGLMTGVSQQMGQIESILDNGSGVWDKRVMVSLSTMKSPFVAGSGTFISDILSVVHADNIYKEEYGWPQITVESIVKLDPEVIIIVTNGYPPTESGYATLLDSLSNEWKATKAYKNGEIYVLSDEANDLASRPGPRVAQLTELMARILHPTAFDDGITIPKYVGDNYTDYLSITI